MKVKDALALFEAQINGTTLASLDAQIAKLVTHPHVDDIVAAHRYEPDKGRFVRRVGGNDYEGRRLYARQALVMRARPSKVVDAVRGEVTKLYVGDGSTQLGTVDVTAAELAAFPKLESVVAANVNALPPLRSLVALTIEHGAMTVLDLASFPSLESLCLRDVGTLKKIDGWAAPKRLVKADLLGLPKIRTLALAEAKALEWVRCDPSFAIDLSGLKRLQTVDLRTKRLDDLSMLADAKSLVKLDVDAPVVSLHGLEGHHALADLNVMSNALADISALSGLRGLVRLRMFGKFTSLAGLGKKGLPALETLQLQHDHIRSLDGIERCPKITSLQVGHCAKLADISAAARLPELRELWITCTPKLGDLTVLTQPLTKIRALGNAKKSKKTTPAQRSVLDPKNVSI